MTNAKQQKQQREDQKKKGLCLYGRCKKKPVITSLCEEHLKRCAERSKAYRKRRTKKNLCPYGGCRRKKPISSYLCIEHSKQHKLASNAWNSSFKIDALS